MSWIVKKEISLTLNENEMKKLMFLLMMVLTLSSTAQINQKNKVQRKWDKYDNLYDDTTSKTNFIVGTDTPGKCLIKSSRSTIGSLFCTAIGSVIIAYSFNKDAESEAKTFRAIGGLTMFTGIILEVRGIILIGKAGKLMENERQKSLSYNISPTKIGLAFNF